MAVSSESGTLFVAATLIVAIWRHHSARVARSGDAIWIAAEDTRVTRKLLAHFDIHTPLTSYHQHTEARKVGVDEQVAEGAYVVRSPMLETPASPIPRRVDYGFCIEAGLDVVVIPPSAVIAPLLSSGLPTRRFAFEGFLPRAAGERRVRLAQFAP